MNRLISLLLLAFFLAPAASGQKGDIPEFDPPPIVLLTPAEQDRLRSRLEEPEAAAAFRPVLQAADEALARRPAPLAALVYEGRISSDTARLRTVRHLQDMAALEALTWAYVGEREARYAEGARRYLLAWARTYRPTGNDVNENKLGAGFMAYHYLALAWPEAARDSAAAWLAEIVEAQRLGWEEGRRAGNRAAKRLKLIYVGALLLGDESRRRWAEDRFMELVAASLRPDGTSYDLERRDAMHYHVSGLLSFVELAHAARLRDAGLYARAASNGASVKRSVEYAAPYARGERVRAEWVDTKVQFDRERAASGDPFYQPGKPWNPREAYPLFILSAGFDPALAPVVPLLRPEGASGPEWLEVVAR